MDFGLLHVRAAKDHGKRSEVASVMFHYNHSPGTVSSIGNSLHLPSNNITISSLVLNLKINIFKSKD